MIAYLVSASDEQGIKDAMSRGWTGIARTRFVTPNRDDIRVIRRMADLVPFSNGTPMIKGSDYETGPEKATEGMMEAWLREKEEFDRFVAEGNGRWVEAL